MSGESFSAFRFFSCWFGFAFIVVGLIGFFVESLGVGFYYSVFLLFLGVVCVYFGRRYLLMWASVWFDPDD